MITGVYCAMCLHINISLVGVDMYKCKTVLLLNHCLQTKVATDFPKVIDNCSRQCYLLTIQFRTIYCPLDTIIIYLTLSLFSTGWIQRLVYHDNSNPSQIPMICILVLSSMRLIRVSYSRKLRGKLLLKSISSCFLYLERKVQPL